MAQCQQFSLHTPSLATNDNKRAMADLIPANAVAEARRKFAASQPTSPPQHRAETHTHHRRNNRFSLHHAW